MAITAADVRALEQRINAQLAHYPMQFVMTAHFSHDRLNDTRNNPPISIPELDDVFNRLISQHLHAILALHDGDTFNIRCLRTHTNMPCAVRKIQTSAATAIHKNIVLTIMRKQYWFSRDPFEFQVQ